MSAILGGPVATSRPQLAWTGLARNPVLIILLAGLLFSLLLAVPGQTVASSMLEDLFALLDGVQRLAWGLIPSRDFHSALGPLAYYIPGLGYALTGSLGAALPLGMATLVAAMAIVLAYVLPSRLSPGLAIPFGIFLLVVLAAPLNLGDGITILSFNQFYNRIGWVGLSALLVLFLPARGTARAQMVLDTVCATALTLVLLYTRATYGIVALAFLVFMLTDMRQWRWPAVSLVAVALVALGIEVFWNGTSAYVGDVALAFAAGGWIRGTPAQWLELFLGNFADYTLLALLAGLLLWRRLSLRVCVLVLFCAVAGFWLINQNDQRWGILVIHAAGVIIAERLLRDMSERRHAVGAVVNPPGVQLYMFGFLFPTIVHCTAALLLHASASVTTIGQPLSLPRFGDVRIANLWTPAEFGGSIWYLNLVDNGIEALKAAGTLPGRIVVLGGPNPFSASLDLPPAFGDVAQMRWGASHSAAHHIAAEQFLGSADTVMERLAAGGIGELGPIYLPYIADNFRLAAETLDWRVFRRAPISVPAEQ